MRRIALVVGLLAAVAAPSTAAAKGRVELEICGAPACRNYVGDSARPLRTSWPLVMGVLNLPDRFTFASAPPLSPYYTLQLEADWYEWSALAYVPDANVVRTTAGWVRIDRPTAARLRDATRGLEPFPAPKLERVRVNGRPVADAAVYAGLFAKLPPSDPPLGGTPGAKIVVQSAAPDPWTKDARLTYYPSRNVLRRDTEVVEVPDTLATQIEADLRREGVEGRRGWGSSIVFALVFTGALFVGWLTFYRRKWWKTGGRRKVRAPEGEAPRSSPRR
jgi:hypothetical protein